MANSQLWRHITLQCNKFENIRHIESTSLDFMTIPFSQNIVLPIITELKEKRRGTKGMKLCKNLCLKKLEHVNKKQIVRWGNSNLG